MNAIESLRISWRNIRDHKLRSTLTTLGVIIGVAAVITFVALGASLQADIIATFAGGDASTMYVTASTPGDSGFPDLGGGQTVFTEHDVNEIRSRPGVVAAVPEGGIAASFVGYENVTVARQWITVTTPEYFEVRDRPFVEGRPFRSGETEVVLNRPAAEMVPGKNVSVGDRIVITRAANREELNATVVGIIEASGTSVAGFTQGPRPQIFAPADPYYKRTVIRPGSESDVRVKVYNRLLVRAAGPGQVDAVQGRIYKYLGDESDARLLKSQAYEFDVTTQDELVNQLKRVSNTFTAYITGIALISLVVGSIGIANIMLVSVTERTREIGIMKAIGARNLDVLQLFLMESVLLGVAGSALGAAVGIVGGYAAARAIGLPAAFPVQWIPIAVLVGMAVGVLAGLYPAWDAARTDPIEALRYE